MDPAKLSQTARRLTMEKFAIEAYSALNGDGIGVRVVKGLTLVAQLYTPDEHRSYVDTDLLVNPAHWDRATRRLRDLGYGPAPAGGLFEHPVHSVCLRRVGGTGVTSDIDLHHRFHGVRISSRAFWAIAGSDPVPFDVGAATVLTTPLPVTGFHLAVSMLTDHGGTSRHRAEWVRFAQRYPMAMAGVKDVAHRCRATNDLLRALAVAEGVSDSEAPRPLPPRVRNIHVSAWLTQLRRAPTMRARWQFTREVISDQRQRALGAGADQRTCASDPRI